MSTRACEFEIPSPERFVKPVVLPAVRTSPPRRLELPVPASSLPQGRQEKQLVDREVDLGASTREAGTPGKPLNDPLVGEFVKIALAPDPSLVRGFVDTLLERGMSVQSIYLDLLAPTARALGEMWDEDECGFVEVTTGVGHLQLVLRNLSQMFVRDRPEEDVAGRVLLACIPGEQHSLGLFMVAEFFVRDGWEVHVGPPLSGEQLLADVRAEWYDVIGFSVSCDSRLDHLKREIRRVRQASKNGKVVILAGGRAFNQHPGLLERIGADASAANAELAPERARQMLAL